MLALLKHPDMILNLGNRALDREPQVDNLEYEKLRKKGDLCTTRR